MNMQANTRANKMEYLRFWVFKFVIKTYLHYENRKTKQQKRRGSPKGQPCKGCSYGKGQKKKQRKQFNTNNSLLLSVSGAIKNISVSVSGRKMHFL